jgi:predicted nucleic acid-binding protein
MIVIDTNVISELMKPSPQLSVVKWLDKQDVMQLFVSTITIAEISYGISVLPDGQRKRSIEDSFNKALNEAFKHRILSFDENAAHSYGKIMGHRKMLGRPMSIPDGQIAAIALTHNFSIATRNVRDFMDCEVGIINPFD